MRPDGFRPPRGDLFFRSQDEFALCFVSPDRIEFTSMEGHITRYRRARPWTPTAADLTALDGRYASAELGSVVEIVPGTNALVMRLDRSPDKVAELAPVERDTYMRRMMIVRVRRDTSGKVAGLDHGNPLVRNLPFTRLGDRAPGSAPSARRPTPPGAALAAAPVAPTPRLEGLASEYALAAHHPDSRPRRRRSCDRAGHAAERQRTHAAEGAVTTAMRRLGIPRAPLAVTQAVTLAAALLLVAPRTAPAQGRQFTLDLRPFSAAVGYARRVAPGRLVGAEVGLGSPQLELTLTPRGRGYRDFEELLHLGLFARFVPSDRIEADVGVRAAVADVTTCDTSDCLPGVFGGAYMAAYYGRRRLKVGALVQVGRAAESGRRAVTVLNVSPLVARLRF